LVLQGRVLLPISVLLRFDGLMTVKGAVRALAWVIPMYGPNPGLGHEKDGG